MNQKYNYLIFFFCFQIFTESFGYQTFYNDAVPFEDVAEENYSPPKFHPRGMNIVERLYKRSPEPSQSAMVVSGGTDTNSAGADLQRVLFEKLFGVKSLFVDILKTLFNYVSHNMKFFKKYVADLPILGPDKAAMAPLSLLGPLYEILKLLSKAIFTE